MNIAQRTVLVTGANRGLGRALVEEALSRGAERVYAGSRTPVAHTDERVTSVSLDITEAAQIEAAAERVGSLDVLINNAGIATSGELGDRAVLDQHLAVNFFGTWAVTQAFLPQLTRNGGAVVNVLSLAALAAMPIQPAYSVSKAAAFSLTQSLRARLAGTGVGVHGVMAGPLDTDMSREIDVPKTAPASAAAAIFDGLERGDEEIFPDAMSAPMAEAWGASVVKDFERQLAAMVAA